MKASVCCRTGFKRELLAIWLGWNSSATKISRINALFPNIPSILSSSTDKNLLNHHRIFDADDDPHGPAAGLTDLDINVKYPLEALRQSYRCAMFDGRLDLRLIRWLQLCPLTEVSVPIKPRHTGSGRQINSDSSLLGVLLQYPLYWYYSSQSTSDGF